MTMFDLLRRKNAPRVLVVDTNQLLAADSQAGTDASRQLGRIIKPAIERPVARIVRLPSDKADRVLPYSDISSSIGFRPAQLILMEMYNFFEKSDIPIFKYSEVKAYLTSKKPKGVDNWCWRALRKRDAVEGYIWGFENGRPGDGYYHSKKWECRPYESLVPAHALEKTARIQERFGGDVSFFVSDFARPDTDPFIMCRPTPCDSGDGGFAYQLIFDVWDEPGFGGVPVAVRETEN